MIERIKNILSSYRLFAAGIPENVGELIACVLYLAFSAGMVMVVVGPSEGSDLALNSGFVTSGSVLALAYSA